MRMGDIDLLIGFDTEYVAEHASARAGETLAFDPDKVITAGNRVLCISFALYSPSTGQRFSGVVPIPPSRKRRWTLKQFAEQVLDAAMDIGMLTPHRMREADDRHPRKRQKALRIIMCGHFTRADLPGFADFNKLKRKFSAVRKTYTSIMTPYVFTARPGRHRTQVSITLRDTRLLAPAGFGSLDAISKMLALPKLSVPEVKNECAEWVEGITRMDLVQARHPAEFEAYARRDAEVALQYLLKVHELACELGVSGIPATIGSMGVKMFRKQCGDRFAAFMGRVPDPKRKNTLMLHPAISEAQGMWANAFHGGRNQCFAHGVFDAPAGRQWNDIDLASAYTVAMAAIPTIDWNSASAPRRLEDIATTWAATVARVRFRFPDGTRLPCLPVRVDAGLLFPLEGETTTTGVEILTALSMGAEIEVLSGHRFEFTDSGYEYAAFTQRIADFRARFKISNPLFEKLAKEAGNSLYGKTAQAVAGMRTIDSVKVKQFDTTSGERITLPPSTITNPVHAALTTALVRAVLAEILSSLPPDRAVLSVTTDGFLTDCTLEEVLAASNGPACLIYKAALERVAPAKPLLEVKHDAATVAVARTRGAFTVSVPAGYEGPPILARAGHKLEQPPGDPWAEATEFARIFRERTPETTLMGRDFISVEDQWMADADLVALPVARRVNLDYDFCCRPVSVEDANGLLRLTTEPWRDARAYKAARRVHARLRDSGGQLKGLADWRVIEPAVNAAAAVIAITVAEEACLTWLRAVVAVRLCGKGKAMSLAEGAATMAEFGLPTSVRQLADAGKKARARHMRETGMLPNPPAEMARFLPRLEARFAPNRCQRHGATVIREIKNLLDQ